MSRRFAFLSPRAGRDASRGQVVVIFALSIFVFVGLCGLVLDVAWYWANDLRLQRATDAAALAGVVYLPGDETTAISTAKAEASMNGFTDGVGGVTIAAAKSGTNPRSLVVTINGSFQTFFMRLFGVSTMAAVTTSQAEYVLPVPMGSPENYYGVFGQMRTPAGGTTGPITYQESSSAVLPANTQGTNTWTHPTYAQSSTDAAAVAVSASTSQQAWTAFTFAAPGSGTITIKGIELQISAKGASATGCTLTANVYRSSGSAWATAQATPTLTTTLATYTLGGPNSLWGATGWVTSDFTSSNHFAVRLNNTTTSGCANDSVDWITAKVYWSRLTTTTIPDPNLTGPNSETLNARGFWGAMLSQGAININGDAYLPYYATRISGLNTNYNTSQYYDYAVQIPAGATNGNVWVFDPDFCATDSSGQFGTGDRWLSGSAAISAFYTLYDTKNTLYDLTDDTVVASSDRLFANLQASDSSLNGSGGTSCKSGDVSSPTNGNYWHNKWWPLATGLTGGTTGHTYRVHTATTDPTSSSAQLNADGQNNFALFANATGGSPQIYGIGAMEAFYPLDGGTAAEFYLAKIEAIHAGKTVVVSLWDPGDTNALPANLQFLIPTTTGYTAATLSWTSVQGTTNSGASSCTNKGATGVTQIVTNTGGNSQFNGCWLTVSILVPSTYTAPTPPGETSGGWWKIRYTMGGLSTDTPAFDVVTLQVTIRGNPVHLVLP